jgi:hypothetical protein
MSGPIHRLTAAATIAGGLLVLATTIASGQQTPVRAVPDAFARGAERQLGPIHIVPIRRDRIFLMASAEGNSTVQVGEDGVVVVDTMTAALAPRLLEAIRTVAMGPILQIVNTNADRTGGNEVIRKAGRAVGDRPGGGASILAFETVLNRMSADGSAAPPGAWPRTPISWVARTCSSTVSPFSCTTSRQRIRTPIQSWCFGGRMSLSQAMSSLPISSRAPTWRRAER